MDARCRIELLGGLRVQQGEQRTITRFRTRQTGALLAYLAYHLGRHLPREVLIEAIWPDAEARTGRNNLRIALHSLRSQLEPPGVPAGAVLQTDRFAAGLNPAAVVTDVGEFLAAVQKAETAPEDTVRHAVLRQAIDLYRGELLPGLYDTWVLDEKDRLQALYEQAQEDWQSGLEEASNQQAPTVPTSIAPPAITAPILLKADAQTQNAHLPLQFTNFFGREEEFALLERWVAGRTGARAAHLITLTGPGGSGKTRLAIEAAGRMTEAFPGGIWFVSLQDLSDPRLIPGTVLDALRLPRSPLAEPLHQVVEFLNGRGAACLLVLDNLEHLLEAGRRKAEDGAAFVRALLDRCPVLTCLVTSRQRLDLEGEREFPVLPLPVPGNVLEEKPITSEQLNPRSPEVLMQFAGVQLFVDRAQSGKPDFQITAGNATAIGQLCDRLEGIPLALELAARCAPVMTPKQMLSELEHRFAFLVSRRRDATERHRTLHAAIEWSYRLLSPPLQTFFASLSVFRGGWTAEAAEAICEEPQALESLAQLREYSLVLAQESAGASGESEMRFSMLETLREFAAERLTPDVLTHARENHARYYCALAENAFAAAPRNEAGYFNTLVAPATATPPGSEPKEPVVWFAPLEADHDNLREALTWASELDAERVLRLANALWPFWNLRGYSEGYSWLERIVSTGAGSPALRAQAMSQMAAYVRNWKSDYATARRWLEQVLPIARTLKDGPFLAWTLSDLGEVEEGEGDYAASRAHQEEALALLREWGDLDCCAQVLNALGTLSVKQGDYEAAQTYLEESLVLMRQIHGAAGGHALALRDLGRLSSLRGDYARATALLEEALELYRRRTFKLGIRSTLHSLGRNAMVQGDYERAIQLLEEALAIARESGEAPGWAAALGDLAVVALRQGDEARAEALGRESLQLSVSQNLTHDLLDGLEGLGMVACARRPRRAARLFGAAEALRESLRAPRWPGDRADYSQHVGVLRARLNEADFEAAWAEGRALTLEQAVACALEATG
jgi:predicted ATPase/Tfp pilus assembly protein PilF